MLIMYNDFFNLFVLTTTILVLFIYLLLTMVKN